MQFIKLSLSIFFQVARKNVHRETIPLIVFLNLSKTFEQIDIPRIGDTEFPHDFYKKDI